MKCYARKIRKENERERNERKRERHVSRTRFLILLIFWQQVNNLTVISISFTLRFTDYIWPVSSKKMHSLRMLGFLVHTFEVVINFTEGLKTQKSHVGFLYTHLTMFHSHTAPWRLVAITVT